MRINIGKLIILIVWVLIGITGAVVIYILYQSDDPTEYSGALSSPVEEISFPVSDQDSELVDSASRQDVIGEFEYVVTERKKSPNTKLYFKFGNSSSLLNSYVIDIKGDNKTVHDVVQKSMSLSARKYDEFDYEVMLPNGYYIVTLTFSHQTVINEMPAPVVRIDKFGKPVIRVAPVVPRSHPVISTESRSISLNGGKVFIFLDKRDMTFYESMKSIEKIESIKQLPPNLRLPLDSLQ